MELFDHGAVAHLEQNEKSSKDGQQIHEDNRQIHDHRE